MSISEGQTCPQGEAEKIMHVSLPISETAIMGNDSFEPWEMKLFYGNNFSFPQYRKQKKQTSSSRHFLCRWKIIMPMENTFLECLFWNLG
jgi:PhnB protein